MGRVEGMWEGGKFEGKLELVLFGIQDSRRAGARSAYCSRCSKLESVEGSSSCLILGDPGHRSEDDLPSNIHDTPQLRIEHAQRAHVLPQAVDDLDMAHQTTHRALGPAALERRACQGVREASELVRAELRDVHELVRAGARTGCAHLRERGREGGEERREERVGAHGMEVRVQERVRFRAGDG